MPRSRKTTASTPTGSPFPSFNPPSSSNPFASISSPSSAAASLAPAPALEPAALVSKPFSFMAPSGSSDTPDSKPAFSFGTPKSSAFAAKPAAAPATTPASFSPGKSAETPAATAAAAAAPTPSSPAKDASGQLKSTEYVKFLKVRALNESFKAAVTSAIDKDPLADLTKSVNAYSTFFAKIIKETEEAEKQEEEFAKLKDEEPTKAEETKPANGGFTWGQAAPAGPISFGKPAGDSTPSAPAKPVFSFGTPTVSKPVTETNSTPFSFGGSAAAKPTTPSFSFGANKSLEQLAAEEPASDDNSEEESGEKEEEKIEDTKDEPKKTETPKFSFGAPASPAPFSFGAPAEKKEGSTFNFGKTESVVAPSPFNFGAKPPAFGSSNEKTPPSNEADPTVVGSPLKISSLGAASSSNGSSTFSLAGSNSAFGSASPFKFNVPASEDKKGEKPSEDKKDDKTADAQATPIRPPAFSFSQEKLAGSNSTPVFSTGAAASSPFGNNTWTPDKGIKFGTPVTSSDDKSGSSPAKPVSSGFGGFGGFGSAAPTTAPAPNLGFSLFSSKSAEGNGEAAPASSTFSFKPATPSAAPVFGKPAESSTGSEAASGEMNDDSAPPEAQIDLSQEKGPGEEEEDVVTSGRTKIYQYKKAAEIKAEDESATDAKDGYVPIGLGNYKLLQHQTTKKSRILVRADGSGRVLLNVMLRKAMNYTTMGQNVRILDFKPDNQGVSYLIKLKTSGDAEKLKDLINEKKAEGS